MRAAAALHEVDGARDDRLVVVQQLLHVDDLGDVCLAVCLVPHDAPPLAGTTLVRPLPRQEVEGVGDDVEHRIEASRRSPSVEPGVLRTSAAPTVPATARDSRPRGLTRRMASARPGASRSSAASVPSGVRSRGPNPVPPVVTTRPANPAQAATTARRHRLHAVGHGQALDHLEAGAAPRCSTRAGPTGPPACPSATPSDTVITFAWCTITRESARTGRGGGGGTCRRCRRPAAGAARRGRSDATARPARRLGLQVGMGSASQVVVDGRALGVGEGAHGVHELAAGAHERDRRLDAARRWIAASRSTASASIRQRASGRRRSTPRPEHGASTRTRSNAPGRNADAVPSATTTDTQRRPAAGVGRDERRAAWSDVGSHDVRTRAGEDQRLATRRRAQVEHPLPRLCPHRLGHPLRREVLHVPVVPLGDGRRLVHPLEGGRGIVRAEVGGEPLDDPVGVAEAGGLVGPHHRVGRHLAEHGVDEPRARRGATSTVSPTAACGAIARKCSW